MSMPDPMRGDVWRVNFAPQKGAEIRKRRPAVVMSVPGLSRLPLRIVIPILGWKPYYASSPWLYHLKPTAENGLDKESAADATQVKSFALERFEKKLGKLVDREVQELAALIVLCVGA